MSSVEFEKSPASWTRPHLYRVHGLMVHCSFPLPGSEVVDAEVVPDVAVRCGPLPESLPGATLTTASYQTDGSSILLTIRDVARYLVRDGQEIIVERAADASDADVRLFLLGSAFAALCHQRKLLPLHASAVEVNHRCAAFLGPSGIGKSTLAAFLVQRGFPLVCDDVCVLGRYNGDAVSVSTNVSFLKLKRDGLSALQRGTLGPAASYVAREKYYVPARVKPERALLQPWRLYLLSRTEADSGPSIRQLTGFDAVAGLVEGTYRLHFVPALGLTSTHFSVCAAVARVAEIYRLSRPFGLHRMGEVLECLEHHWQTAGDCTGGRLT